MHRLLPLLGVLVLVGSANATDVEYHLGADVLGEIGSVREVAEKDRPTLVKSERDETATEQFRALFSQLSIPRLPLTTMLAELIWVEPIESQLESALSA